MQANECNRPPVAEMGQKKRKLRHTHTIVTSKTYAIKQTAVCGQHILVCSSIRAHGFIDESIANDLRKSCQDDRERTGERQKIAIQYEHRECTVDQSFADDVMEFFNFFFSLLILVVNFSCRGTFLFCIAFSTVFLA